MSVEASEKPILITGAHRSGTTWLANMLALGGDTLIAHEPFQIESWAYALDGLAKRYFTYAPALSQDAAHKAFEKVLERRTRKIFLKNEPQHWLPLLRRGRLIIKDPIAAFSSDWLDKNFALDTIVLVRHPAAFAASLKRLGWKHPFEHFLEQELLMQEHLEQYRDEIASNPNEIVDQASLLWNCIYSVLFSFLKDNPSWLVRKHEDLSRDPVPELSSLYRALGLKWTSEVEEKVKEYTQSGNPVSAPEGVVHQMRRDSAANISKWKKTLTEEEIVRVYEATRPVAAPYYPDEEWGDLPG
jgi:hypothetical protein